MFQKALKVNVCSFQVPLYVIVPAVRDDQGKPIKDYDNPVARFLIFASFKTYGGTETTNNGVIQVLETAEVMTAYDPRISSLCRIELAECPGEIFDIIGAPEDLERSHEVHKFKVQRVGGGA